MTEKKKEKLEQEVTETPVQEEKKVSTKAKKETSKEKTETKEVVAKEKTKATPKGKEKVAAKEKTKVAVEKEPKVVAEKKEKATAEVKEEVTVEEKTEVAVEADPEVKEEAVAEVKEEIASEEKTEVVAEIEPEVIAEEKVEATIEAKEEIEVVAEAKPEVVAKVKEEIATEKKAAKTEEFDWASLESGIDVYSEKERTDLENLYNDTLNTVSEKEVLEGTVISLNKREVVVDIGYKSDGIVSLNEFRYNPELKIGDKVDVFIESLEDKKGQMILSHKQARSTRSWERVNLSLENSEIITGFIKCRTKGGMIVDVFGIEAFLPGSQIDVKPIRDYDVFVGKTMEFKVVKINQEYRNVVVSHKALIEAELELQKKEIIAKLEKGQVLEGTVKNVTSYGVFIDLGGVDGLIHITDLSWGRISHPTEIVELDQKMNVVILDFDNDKKRIALGLKQLTPHPWDNLDEKLKVGDKVKGKVVVIADYGAFVEITTGVEGLIHVSEMSWSQHLRSAQDFLKVGDEVEASILTLDRDERKMSLGIKQLKDDPWEQIDKEYSVGSKHKATVRNFTNFGVFVEITEGVDGLIHISDLSWTKKIKHPSEFTAVGETIEVAVLDIDKENHRLSLGHKQLEENPWDVFETIFTTDSIHEGTVVELMDRGAVIALPYGVEGFATPRHLIKEDGASVVQDEKLDFKVIEFNKSAKRIIVSHSRIFEDVKRAEDSSKRRTQTRVSKKAVKPVKDNIEKTTLGDISELAALKTQMEANEKKDK